MKKSTHSNVIGFQLILVNWFRLSMILFITLIKLDWARTQG